MKNEAEIDFINLLEMQHKYNMNDEDIGHLLGLTALKYENSSSCSK